ncbi:MAG: MarR family winged helix-turn-helix transcriptional regulator [Bacillota bacterium]
MSSILEQGMSPPQFLMMRLLSQSDRMTASDLAEVLGVTPSAVTYLCDRLASVGFVSRERDIGDRRMVWLCLTEPGRAKMEELESKRMELMRHFLGGLPLEDMDHLVAILGRLDAAIDETPHHSRP